ncbi:hypothetical protein DU508_21820 [Pedobacter chinensis]|uniref:Uncharacterized protein n=1 Tax=Pedobacter chinensis TaxID=2282421 RepID=A0A369PP39_9SPHI|nr:hypothetical protein DU508_21820 [Pedobacter chinensis]
MNSFNTRKSSKNTRYKILRKAKETFFFKSTLLSRHELRTLFIKMRSIIRSQIIAYFWYFGCRYFFIYSQNSIFEAHFGCG